MVYVCREVSVRYTYALIYIMYTHVFIYIYIYFTHMYSYMRGVAVLSGSWVVFAGRSAWNKEEC